MTHPSNSGQQQRRNSASGAEGTGSRAEEAGTVERGQTEKGGTLPCRLSVVLQGAEWFIYNRSAAYDSLLSEILQETHLHDGGGDSSDRGALKRRSRATESQKLNGTSTNTSTGSRLDYETSKEKELQIDYTNTRETSSIADIDGRQSTESSDAGTDSLILHLLPIHIECTKAAVVMGNENTKAVLIAKAEFVSGEINATYCKPPDHYRQLINFDFRHPIIQFKPNEDYREDQADAALRMADGSGELRDQIRQPMHQHSFWHRQRRKATHKLQNLVPYFMTSVESVSTVQDETTHHDRVNPGANLNQWQGLSRYLDDSEDEKAKWSTIEYAAVANIVDSPGISMSYYWDIPGTVPSGAKRSGKRMVETSEDINGSGSPGFGLDLIVRGGSINYGPWADRQRAELQKGFFPSVSKDSSPSKVLRPGQTRVSTGFKVYVQLDDDATIRVPIREESKNWKWKRQADTMGQYSADLISHGGKRGKKRKSDKGKPGMEVRPFGWLDIKVASNSTLTYHMDMVAGVDGFSNSMELDLPDAEVTTSVNHGLLLRSRDQRLSCDLSNPLKWNGMRTWRFDIISNGLELFMLREHVFLLIDLVDDWGSGPSPDYLNYTPFQYATNLQFADFKIFLNVNDSNIINNPSDFEDNTFLSIFGHGLSADICIPLDKFRPHKNDIPFDIKAHTGGLKLHVPPWNTQATFLASTDLATLQNLGIKGSYQYCATTSVSNTDILTLDVTARALDVQIYGFLVRYLFRLKDNYFGEDIHFKTLEEYQQILQAQQDGTPDPSAKPPPKKSNDLDVMLGIHVDSVGALLPANLYSCKYHTRLDMPNLQADLRFTNYYMDLGLALGPIALSPGSQAEPPSTPVSSTTASELFIESLNIYGHRVFGLPPTEPTYVCNWDLAVGAVTGECSAEFLTRLIDGGKAFAFTFDDDENALPSISNPVVYDVTFLRVSVEPVRVWVHVDDSVLLLSTGAVDLNFNDWAGLHYSKKLSLEIPDVCIALVDAESAVRHRSRIHQPVENQAYIVTAISLTMLGRKLGFAQDRLLQQEHLLREDLRTHRTDFLLREGIITGIPGGHPAIDPPAMCFPPLPLPTMERLNGENHSYTSASTPVSRHRKTLQRRSSFLSIASSSKQSQSSILRSHRSPSESARPGRGVQRGQSSNRPGGNYIRNISTSTGRQSSFYSAVGDHGDRKGVPNATSSLTSPYIAPHFPLNLIQLDPSKLPDLDVDDETEPEYDYGGGELLALEQRTYDEHATHSSFIIELKQGIRAYLSPEGVYAVTRLIAAMNASTPDDLLDKLHIDSISAVFDIRKQSKILGNSTDLSVRIPGIGVRFASASPLHTFSTSHDASDQYDLSLNGLTLTARSTATAARDSPGAAKKNQSLVHFKLRSANLAGRERSAAKADTQSAINLTVRDVIFWMSSGGALSGNLNVQLVEMTTRGSKVEYVASLLHRTANMVSEFQDTFESMSVLQRNRIHLLAWLVVTAGQEVSDPVFFTRPSYVLRSAPDHLRFDDSWKVITRLRHMYSSLDPMVQQDIIAQIASSTEHCPNEAPKSVLAAFDRWRSWDLADLKHCVAMQRIYGPFPEDSETKTLPTGPIRLALQLGQIKFLIGQGPKQSNLSLTTLLVRSTLNDTSVSGPTTDHHGLQVELFCEEAAVNLHWELCDLIENALNGYAETPNGAKSSSSKASTSSRSSTFPTAHIIVAIQKGSVTVDTINIHAVSICDGLKLSIVLNERDASRRTGASLMITADAVTTHLRSHFQELTVFQLRRPSIYVANATDVLDGHEEEVWKAAANSQQLTFIVKQDPVVLTELADLLVGDEVTQLYRLVQKLPSFLNHGQAPHHDKPPKLIRKVNVALFLDMYHLSLPLLQTLTYNVSGAVARASLAASQDTEFVFDFDIKENSHDVKTSVDNQTRSISLLQLPPTNGRVIFTLGHEENVVSIFASLERVDLDAASIHSLLTALNRPEITSVISDVRQNVEATQRQVQGILGPSNGGSTPSPSQDVSKCLIYDAHCTFAGLTAFADTPVGGIQDCSARLLFEVGCVQLEAANRIEPSGPPLHFPEARLDLKHILCELTRTMGTTTEPCGNFVFSANLRATSNITKNGDELRYYYVQSEGLEINMFAETASTAVDVLGHLQDRIKDLDFSREKGYLQRLRRRNPRIAITDEDSVETASVAPSTNLFSSIYTLELLQIQISWIVSNSSTEKASTEKENLVLSCSRIDLSTRRENAAKLTIEDLQLQMVPLSQDKTLRSPNSALLPEVIFNVAYVSTIDARRLAFQAVGKALDLQLTSNFLIPARDLRKSIQSALNKVSAATANWRGTPAADASVGEKRKPFFGKKRMESLLMDADFAGAMVHLQGKNQRRRASTDSQKLPGRGYPGRSSHHDRSNQSSRDETNATTVLRSPGLAWKVEYRDNGIDDPSLMAEIKINASSNTLYPTVVPLVLEMSSSLQDIVNNEDDQSNSESQPPPQKAADGNEDKRLATDPAAMLGRTRLNLGIRICAQEFSLSCQPIARVAATARFDDIYLTINTVRTVDQGHFFALTAAVTRLQAAVQHVYSRESTGSFDVESVVLSLMNSKHVSGTSGMSVILNISPMKVLINAKQLQDYLLFREIWYPAEIRQTSAPPVVNPSMAQSQNFSIHRYQEVAATGAFPWNATIAIAELDVQLDLGQAIGKPAFIISKFWMSAKKNSDWEQNLCLGFEKVGLESTGRTSGFITLEDFRIRTSITWPEREKAINQKPLVQASLGFRQFQVNVSFDYQAFLVADVTSSHFLMYNVRGGSPTKGDRLFAVLDGDSVQLFCTTTSASQGLALYQAFGKLAQEKRANFEASIKEIDKFTKRPSVSKRFEAPAVDAVTPSHADKTLSPISLQTDVVVTLKALSIGVFPTTFSDNQVFKIEALDAQARFSVAMEDEKIHSALTLTLGQLRIALAGMKRLGKPNRTDQITVDEVVESVSGSRGPIILRVPQVKATMETWQTPGTNHIDYIFKTVFEGRVEVGWNYSRISYIRGMYNSHSRALASRMGKPLPVSAVRLTGIPDEDELAPSGGEQQKIVAEVNVPQSKYDYTALEPPVIDTPQLKDMGEATPPLEWIGLHRDRLPNLTHQLVIVTLLELASEVEDAYGKILGSS